MSEFMNQEIRRQAARGVVTTDTAPGPASVSDNARRARGWAVEYLGQKAVRNPAEVVDRLDVDWDSLPGRQDVEEALSTLREQDPSAVQVSSGGSGARPGQDHTPPADMNAVIRRAAGRIPEPDWRDLLRD